MDNAHQLAAKELLRRYRAVDSLDKFCGSVRKRYEPGRHHSELCAALEALERREITRLIVEWPPRHGKTYFVSEAFPAWYIGRNPTHSVISASHSDGQARRSGRRVRSMVASDDYQVLFPGTRLDKRSDASDEFATSEGGLYLAVGMTGSFMGTGADLMIVDDPFKSRAAAESPTIRRRVMSSYDDLENRLEPGAVVVVMHTRWHEGDLVGNLEKTRIRTGIEKWHRITSPMIANECPQWEQVEACERGTAENEQDAANQRDAEAYERERALWPEHYDIDACRAIRRRVPQRTWVSLYQQRPSSEQGGFFLRESIQRFAPTADESDGGPPANLNLYLACDYGVTEDGDRTEIYLVGIDERNHWWVLECWKGSVSSDVWCGALVDMVVEHRPHAVAGEAGVIRRAVEPFITLMMDESRAATVFLWASRGSNKSACAVGLQGIASMRRLHVAYGNWGDELVAALVAFPTSDDDHGVDALANLSLCMEQTPGAFALPVDGGHNRRDKWAEAFRRARSDAASGWKTT